MENLKDKYTVQEMTELYKQTITVYEPNKIRVGKFAQKLGFCLTMQKHMGKKNYFYVKAELI